LFLLITSSSVLEAALTIHHRRAVGELNRPDD
jgi:hypothetical protein